MIIWCCVCQSYVGEKPPFKNYEFTHTYCKLCINKNLRDTEDKSKMDDLKRLYYKFMAKVKDYDANVGIEIVAECEQLGLSKISMFYGIICPLLYKIGEMTDEGTLTVSGEHLFTIQAEKILLELEKNLPELSDDIDILLLCAPGNNHSIGVRLQEIDLRSRNINAKAIYPGVPIEEYESLIQIFKPKAIGISISIPDIIDELLQSIVMLKKKYPVKIVCGGDAFRSESLHNRSEIDFVYNFKDNSGLEKFIREIEQINY